MKCLFASIAMFGLIGGAAAAPVTIDFEDFPMNSLNGQAGLLFNFESRGFAFVGHDQLSAHINGAIFPGPGASNGTITLAMPGAMNLGEGFALTRDGGGEFLLLGMDFAEMLSPPYSGQNAQVIHARGYRGLGLVYDVSLTLDGVVDGPGGQSDFETARFMLPAADTVFFFGTGGSLDNAFNVDNILLDTIDNVENVPTPPAATLLGLGLLMLWSRRFRSFAQSSSTLQRPNRA